MSIAPPVYVLELLVRSLTRYGLSRPEIARELRKRLSQPVDAPEPTDALALVRYREAEVLIRQLENEL